MLAVLSMGAWKRDNLLESVKIVDAVFVLRGFTVMLVS